MNSRTLVYPDATAVAEVTAARFLLATADAVSTRGITHAALTGGGVGIAVLERAAASPLVDIIDWTSVHMWWSDERFLRLGDADRNEVQAQRALLSGLRLPEENIHRVAHAGAVSGAAEAAEAYASELAAFGVPAPAFDIVLLGLGSDGHVASLFPGHPELSIDAMTVVPVEDAPKPPPIRVSMTLPTINRAREVWIVAAGAQKAAAVASSLTREAGIPGGMVRGTERTLWLLDAAAAARL